MIALSLGILLSGMPGWGSAGAVSGAGYRHLKPLMISAQWGGKNLKGKKRGKSLHPVVRDGRLDKKNILLRMPAKLNEADDNGMTPLMVAAMHNRAEAAKLLLEVGRPYIAINAATASYGTTALMIGAMNGFGDIVAELIAKKADLNKVNKSGFTALMMAARGGHTGVVQQLLQAGANRDIRDASYKTAGDYAATDEIKQLLTAPSDAQTDGSTPDLATAIAKLCKIQGNPTRFAALPFSLTVGDKEGGYAYHFLGQDGNASLIYACDEWIVSAQPVYSRGSDNLTALHFWDARTFAYISSVLHNGPMGGSPLISCDAAGGRFAIAFLQQYSSNTGALAYQPTKGILEYQSEFNGNADLPFKQQEFANMPPFTQQQAATPLSNNIALQEQVQLAGLNHSFSTTAENTLRRIDFTTLRSIPYTEPKLPATIKAEEIAGLPAGTKVVKLNEGLRSGHSLCPDYAACIPQQYTTLRDLVWKWNEDAKLKVPLHIYDKRRKQLYSMPQSVLTALGNNGSVKLVFGDSDCEKILHNVLSIHRTGSTWQGPELYNTATGQYEKITFNKPADKAKSNTAYNLTAKIPDTASLGAVMSIWNRVPGDDTHTYWLAAGAGYCTLFLIDESTRSGTVIQSWQGDWGRTEGIAESPKPVWMPEKNWLCLPVKNHCIEVYTFADITKPGEKKFTIYTGAGGAWLIMLNNGHYAGTPGCEKLLYAQTENGAGPVQARAPWRNRPAEVLAALGGKAEAIAALQQITHHRLADLGLNADNMPPEPQPTDFPQATAEKTPLVTESDTLECEVRLTAGAKKALTTLEVRADGSLIPQDWANELLIPPGQSQTVRVRIPLRIGQNNIELTPADSTELAGNPVRFRTVRPGKAESRLFLVSVGVSDYDQDDADLPQAAKDARDLAAAIAEHGSGEIRTLTLTDKEVTRAGICEKARAFLAESRPEDRVVFYLSGRGILNQQQDYYFAPADFNPEQLRATSIAMHELTHLLQSIPARERLLLLETYHNELSPQQQRYIEDLLTQTRRHRGISIVADISAAKQAPQADEKANGAFATALIRTLQNVSVADKNTDGVLAVNELTESIQTQVAQLTNGEQKPHAVIAENSGMMLAIDECNEVIKGDWSSLCRRITKAPGARDALFILDVMATCRRGTGSDSPRDDEETATQFSTLGRDYNDAEIELLGRAYDIGRNSTNRKLPEIPFSVWETALNKGVAHDTIYHHFNWHWNADAPQILRMLIDRGFSPDKKTDEGVPILARVSTPLAQVLLEAGANPNAQDAQGNTVLHRIARESWDNLHKNQIELLQLLFRHGADAAAKNNAGELAVPENSKHVHTIRAIEKLIKYSREAANAPQPAAEGAAPAQLGNNILLCTYHNAEVSRHNVRANQKTPFTPINRRTFGMLTRAYPGVSGSTIRTYTKTGADTAKVTLINYGGAPVICQLLAETTAHLSAEQIADILHPLIKDGSTELELTFTSPTAASATETTKPNADWAQTLRNIQVTLREP